MLTIWEVHGYVGFNDYDGPDDNNICYRLAMPSSVTREELRALIDERYSGSRVIALTLNIVGSIPMPQGVSDELL